VSCSKKARLEEKKEIVEIIIQMRDLQKEADDWSIKIYLNMIKLIQI
jgi:hypothetical protein